MAHNRTEVRNAIVALLSSMVTPVAVHAERRHRIDTTMRPLVVVTLGQTVAEPAQMVMGAPVYRVESTETITLELHADGVDGAAVADELDQMELEAEQILATDLELGGLVEMLYPVGSELEMSADQDRIIGVRSVNFTVAWRNAFGAPDTPE